MKGENADATDDEVCILTFSMVTQSDLNRKTFFHLLIWMSLTTISRTVSAPSMLHAAGPMLKPRENLKMTPDGNDLILSEPHLSQRMKTRTTQFKMSRADSPNSLVLIETELSPTTT
jgi:hypothetical protein